MRGFACPQCESEDLALHSVVWKQGTSTSQYETVSESTSTDYYYGRQFVSHGTHQTTGFSETGLAAECAPPPSADAGLMLGGCATWLVSCGFVYWKLFDWHWDGIDKVVTAISALGLVLAIVDVVTGPKRNAEYRARLERYHRSCVCLRCGTHILLPEGWNDE